MVTSPTSWKCPNPDLEYYQNRLIAAAPTPPYQIPMLGPMDDLLNFVNFDIHDERNRYVEIGTDMTDPRVVGRLMQPCSTECQKIHTVVRTNDLSVRTLCITYGTCDINISPNYGSQESIEAVYPRVLNTSAKQMERWAYKGYNGLREPLKSIDGMFGFEDIGIVKQGGITLPIDPADFEGSCQFFVEIVNDARKGSSPNGGYEFSKSQIDVHVSLDIVDALNCRLVSNTATSVWSQIRSGVLDGVANVIISEQITNSVYAVNREGIYGIHNSIARLGNEYRLPPNKIVYTMFLGTISFGKKTEIPLVYAENVFSL